MAALPGRRVCSPAHCVRPGIVHLGKAVRPGTRQTGAITAAAPRPAHCAGLLPLYGVFLLKGIYPVHGLKNIAVLGAHAQADFLAFAVKLPPQAAHVDGVERHGVFQIFSV